MASITDHQKTVIRHLWERAQKPGYHLVTFQGNHFYSTEGRFGYPVVFTYWIVRIR